MTQISSPEWFLEVDGKKTGPFSADQVVGLLEENEILDTQRVTSESLNGKWITAREMADSHAYSSRPPKAFTPPPRPPERDSTPQDLPIVQTLDPAISLFDALQAAKERKTSGTRVPPSSVPASPNPFSPANIPSKIWLIVGITLLLSGAIWGMVTFIKLRAPPLPLAAPLAAPFAAEPARLALPPPAITRVVPTLPVAPLTPTPPIRGALGMPVKANPIAPLGNGTGPALLNQMPPNLTEGRGADRDSPVNSAANPEPEPVQPPPPVPPAPMPPQPGDGFPGPGGMPSSPQNFEAPAGIIDGAPPLTPPPPPPPLPPPLDSTS